MNNSKLASLLQLDRNRIPADGGDTYNRLIFARSPYLLQHAENPVDWREWGEAAFAEAKARDLPLFVSIGYATCHWCHVMADESFSDREVAKVINELFVPIKVDREERPDIDDFYMTAARALTGGGGWPLNVFIDHERRPFFAMTYLPKYPRHNTPGFINLLNNLAILWRERRETVFNNAREVSSSLAGLTATQPASGKELAIASQEALRTLTEIYDRKFGGFGLAVKFPMPVYLLFLLSRNRVAEPAALPMAETSLTAMANGGIHDQLGGGFHRYAVDQRWQVPHFEKMLYDQAMLIIVYCKAFQVVSNELFLEIARKTATFAVRELLTADGAFCAALDADSDGEEGLYYTWKYDELVAIVGEECRPVLDYWGAVPGGDLDGRCIFHPVCDEATFVRRSGLTTVVFREKLAAATARLLDVRARREYPLRDGKIICAWNGLMVAALARLASVSGDTAWLAAAARTAGFMLEKMVDATGRLVRNWLGEASGIPAFAEDYAGLCFGMVELAQHSPDSGWGERLTFYVNELCRLFVATDGTVQFSGSDSEHLPIEIPPVQDGVTPSTAGLTAVVLIKAGRVLANSSYTAIGNKIIARYRGTVERNPAACLTLLMAEEELGTEPGISGPVSPVF